MSMTFLSEEKQIIGRNCSVDFKDDAQSVPAKVDTGADSSAVWASDIFVDENDVLHFKLFAPDSPYYTGKEYTRNNYTVSSVMNASGTVTIKFKTYLSVKIDGYAIKAYFGLSDRSEHKFPILIGRRTLAKRFLVDVEKTSLRDKSDRPSKRTTSLRSEFRKNPHEFFKNYYQAKGKKK